jgi:diguanylate cyclase (GGDEF)-like protein
MAAAEGPAATGGDDNHFCCALSAVLLARVHRHGGDSAISQVLARAATTRTRDYLADIGNWISCTEMIALWEAGESVTGDPQFARHLGEDAVAQLGGSSTSTVLRTMGSPEGLLRKTAIAGRRFSVVADLEAVHVEPGYAEIRATASAGFERNRLHCQWTQGMFTQASVLFGLPPATVDHPCCQAQGEDECRYIIRWSTGAAGTHPADEAEGLRVQLAAMTERLESVFATAADLIASDDLDQTLARITERAALQVRAPQYVLAVRPTAETDIVWHQKGFDEATAEDVARRILVADPSDHPDHWLVAPVSSHRHHYGSLAAMYRPGEHFFPAERQLLQVYARYAATALDSASALHEARGRQREAQERYRETTALLELARRLATAGSSAEVAGRMVEAVPAVIDCDRVSVYLWDESLGEAIQAGAAGGGGDAARERRVKAADVPVLAELVKAPRPDPIFIDVQQSPVKHLLHELGAVASVAVPIATEEELLGFLVVSVTTDPERLHDTTELRDRLSGVAAHAVQALQNGRLVDQITYQASHDPVTDLANRTGFSRHLSLLGAGAEASGHALALFYIDLDAFKPVNDELGHEVGDSLLRAVASRLADQVRANDVVARLGGDEFAVLVEATTQDQIDRITTRLEQAFETPFQVNEHSLTAHASVGRAVWPADVENHADLLRSADEAMYESKRHRQRASARA